MVTFIRWYMLKAKEVKLKLAFYNVIEKALIELAGTDKDSWEEKFMGFLMGMPRDGDKGTDTQ